MLFRRENEFVLGVVELHGRHRTWERKLHVVGATMPDRNPTEATKPSDVHTPWSSNFVSK